MHGVLPPERSIELWQHSGIAAKHPDGLKTRFYEAGPDGGLRNVLVYIRGDFDEKAYKPPERSAILEHLDGLFQPYVLGIQVGQPLELRDTGLCGFHGMAKKNQEFDVTPMGGVVTRTFTAPELPITFRCDIHPWNYAYVGVFSHPFFAVTDKNGRFAIAGVPRGRYTLEIFHPKSGKSARTISVSKARVVEDFSVTPK